MVPNIKIQTSTETLTLSLQYVQYNMVSYYDIILTNNVLLCRSIVQSSQ